MIAYLDLLRDALLAPARVDRTGVGTRGLFGSQMEFDLQRGFPILTTKKVWFKGVVHELLWMLSGSTNIKPLVAAGVHIWDEWADADGELGPVYGAQWRHWRTGPALGDFVDQISELVERLKSDPFSRRHVVSAWNPADLPSMKLPPCHCLFQFHVAEATFKQRLSVFYKGKESIAKRLTPEEIIAINALMNESGVPTKVLSCKLYQRSADIFLGVPFNISSYALLTHLLAQVTGMIAGKFIWTGGDTHLYLNHTAQAELQCERQPGPLPSLKLNPNVTDLFSFTPEDIELVGYEPAAAIPAPVAV